MNESVLYGMIFLKGGIFRALFILSVFVFCFNKESIVNQLIERAYGTTGTLVSNVEPVGCITSGICVCYRN